MLTTAGALIRISLVGVLLYLDIIPYQLPLLLRSLVHGA